MLESTSIFQQSLYVLFIAITLATYFYLKSVNKYDDNNSSNISFVNQKDKTLHKKWSFPLRVSSVNVTKSVENSGFGHIDWRKPKLKISFCAVKDLDEAVFTWNKNARYSNIPVNGNIIKEKTLSLVKALS